ncbi:hypothetical protein [Chamaesiphon sp. VAR_69_metabat_338]|uniref:hypothetical protein n=1 Tax=Chamaesiphon sp. VAR_69_metabat_338 TaxID=2964704 RepID=UPI00286DA0FF|nr:hypothetical protein [Chamaesiphon sp. VAR_69_metabat_338]
MSSDLDSIANLEHQHDRRQTQHDEQLKDPLQASNLSQHTNDDRRRGITSPIESPIQACESFSALRSDF